MEPTEQAIIRDQNDRFRKGDAAIPGQVVITQGIQAIIEDDPAKSRALIEAVQGFDEFTEGNDPHGFHDFGIFDFEGHRCNWKLDLYDVAYEYGSEEPASLDKTRRVLTILTAREY